MEPKEELTLWKKEIGIKLQSLKNAARFPDNYTPNHIQWQKEGLSLALRGKANVYRLHPELRPPRVQQTNLFTRKILKQMTLPGCGGIGNGMGKALQVCTYGTHRERLDKAMRVLTQGKTGIAKQMAKEFGIPIKELR